MSAEKDYLFGILAVQLGFVSASAVMSAAAAWASDRDRPMVLRLVEEGLLSAERRVLLEKLVAEAVAAHGGDARLTLETFGGEDAVLRSFGGSVVLNATKEISEAPPMDPDVPGRITETERVSFDDVDSAKVVPELLGRYSLREEGEVELGRGGIGRVLLAFDHALGREVAVKELLGEALEGTRSSSSLVARFLREARVTGQLEHPNIVPVYELGRRSDGRLFYTMRVVRGRTLAQALSDCEGLEQRLGFLGHFADLCQAVAYAHSRGVTHRDIKPENVMVGEFGETMLLDWGLAKVAGKKDFRGEEIQQDLRLMRDADAGQTLVGTAIGTPAFMSPEQAEGLVDAIDARSDVWSLGAVLYEILTGRPPHDGVHALEVIGKVISEDVVLAHQRCSAAPRELSVLAKKALRRDPEQRYQSAQELVAEVERYRQGLRLAVYVYSARELLFRFLRRYKASVSVAMVALLVIILAGVLAYRRVVDERDRAELNLAGAMREGARSAMLSGDMLEAHAKLRQSLERNDSPEARGLWQRLRSQSIYWQEMLSSPAYVVASRKDQSLLAVGCRDGAILLVDTLTLGVKRLRGAEGWVAGLAFSPDGDWLAVSGQDKTIHLWNVAEGRPRRSLIGHERSVWDLAYHPSGQWLASVGKDNSLRVWDLASGKEHMRIADPGVVLMAVAYSSDGSMLAAVGGKGVVRVWRATDGEPLFSFEGHQGTCMDVAFSPDGRWLATAGRDQSLRLWPLVDGLKARVLVGHRDAVKALAFSPDSSRLVSASFDQRLLVWDLVSGAVERELLGHSGNVSSLTFLSEGRFVASVGMDLRLIVWDLFSERSRPDTGHRRQVACLDRLDPDFLISGSLGGSVRLWQASTGLQQREILKHDKGISVVKGSPDGRLLLAATADGQILVWDAETGHMLQRLSGHRGAVSSLDISDDGKTIASGGYDKTVRLWGLTSWEELDRWETPKPVMSIELSGDGRNVWFGDVAGFVGHIDVRGRGLVKRLPFTDSWVYALRLVPGERQLVVGCSDGSLVLWDMEKDSRRLLDKKTTPIHFLAMDPGGRDVASGNRDRGVRATDLLDGKTRQLGWHRGEANAVVYSKDGQRVYSSGDDGAIRCWFADGSGPCWYTRFVLADGQGGARVLTHQGWRGLGGAKDEPAMSAWRKAAERALHAGASSDGQTLCLLSPEGELQNWLVAEDRLLSSHKFKPGAGIEVLALPETCAAKLEGEAWLLDRDGARRVASDVRIWAAAQAGGAGIWLMQAGDVIKVLDRQGRTLEQVPAPKGIKVMTADERHLYVGFADGALEGLARAGDQGRTVWFEETPNSQVSSMVVGPHGLLMAGFVNGELGLWRRDGGRRMDQAKLHGSLDWLVTTEKGFFAASDLGQVLFWDLEIFDRPNCDLLRQVWSTVPFVWEQGHLQQLAPNPAHPCLRDLRFDGGSP